LLSNLSVISGKPSEDLAKCLAKRIKANLVKSEIRIFPDGESKITLVGKLSKKKSIVVQSIYPPVDTNLLHALSLISKAKEASSQVIAVIPYMGYARQDREFLPGEVITMKVLAKLFQSSGASKIIVVDIHSLIGLKYFSIKTKNVTAIPDLVEYFKNLSLKNPIVISPDQGGKDRAKQFADKFESEWIALEKKRDRKTGKVKIKTKDIDAPNVDYLVFTRNVERELDDELWAHYQPFQPDYVVEFHDVPYVWIYQARTQVSGASVLNVGDDIRLLGYKVWPMQANCSVKRSTWTVLPTSK